MFCVTLPCFASLSYTFEPIWTNLLTQCTQLPVYVFCCFCISGFPAIKSAPKIPGKYKKNQRNRSFRNHQEREGGPPPGSQEGRWRSPTLGRAKDPPDCLVGPLDAPFTYIYPSGWKPLISISFSRTPLCTAAPAVSRSGLPGEAAPAPCRKEEPPPGDHP